MEPTFFRSAARFRAWLKKNHPQAGEIVLGFHRTSTGRDGITYPEALDEALCFGWIDGIRRRRDDTSYTIRFTPRRPQSIWSRVNTKRVEELQRLGRMTPAGEAAFARREKKKTGVYSFETKQDVLGTPLFDALRHDRKAWAFFGAQAPYYQRQAASWVASAKRAETRARRLALLMHHSTAGERLPQFTRWRK